MARLLVRIVIFGAMGLLTTVALAWAIALRTDWHAGPRWNFGSGMYMLEYPAPHQNTTWTFFPVTGWGVLQITEGDRKSTRLNSSH